MSKLHVRKGDTVQVISGKDRGLTGKVIDVYPDSDRVIVEGVNRIKKHTRVGQNARGAKTGGIVTTEAPVHVSNVMVVDPEDGRPTRIGYRKEKVEKRRPDGSTYESERSVRISKRTGKELGWPPIPRRDSRRATAKRLCRVCKASSVTRTSCRSPRLPRLS